MKILKTLNPEWENAIYEEVYFWNDKFPKSVQGKFMKLLIQNTELRRYKDPEGKIQIPKFILKEEL